MTSFNTATPTKVAGYEAKTLPNGMLVLLGAPVKKTESKPPASPSTPSYTGPRAYTVDEPYTYYKEEVATVNYNGSMVAQTFITKRAGWYTALGLFFTTIAAAGDVHVFITGTTNGKPDKEKVVAKVTVPRNDLKLFPLETKIPLPAHFLEAGDRVGFMVVTEGAHSLALADPGFTEGTFFYGTDGVFFQGDIGKDIKFKYYAAAFEKPRTEIMLQPISLAGGIEELFVATEQPTPSGTSQTYEVQIAGIWKPLTELGNLDTKPDIVPFRTVMLGTSDVQPGLQLGANRVLGGRRALAQIVYSDPITLTGAAKQNYVVDLTIPNYLNTKHTVDCDLLHGAGYSTVTNSTTAVEHLEDGATRIRFTFNAGSAISTMKVKYTITRTADGAPVKPIERTLIAVS